LAPSGGQAAPGHRLGPASGPGSFGDRLHADEAFRHGRHRTGAGLVSVPAVLALFACGRRVLRAEACWRAVCPTPLPAYSGQRASPPTTRTSDDLNAQPRRPRPVWRTCLWRPPPFNAADPPVNERLQSVGESASSRTQHLSNRRQVGLCPPPTGQRADRRLHLGGQRLPLAAYRHFPCDVRRHRPTFRNVRTPRKPRNC